MAMNFNEPYLAYKELVKAREKAKNFKQVKFKDRILTLTRSKPNPKFGGYFISPDGATDNDGRSYLTPITPARFKKIILKDWDKVYFERGHIYNNFTRTITTNNNTFGSFGSGADPKFYGSTTFSAATWTSEAGGYYSTPLASAPKWVFNPAGEAARQGQSDWIPVTSLGGLDSQRIFDSAILNPFNTVQSLVNCKARFKEFNFRMSYEYTIGAYNTGTGEVSFNATVVGASVGYPMKLYGQKQFATLEGDWWYDTSGAKLWIKTASDPTGLDWRVCTQDYGFYLNQATSTTITGLELTQYYRTAIESLRATGTTVTANIHDIRSNGLWWYGNCTGMSFTGTISRCGLSGIFIGAISQATFNITMDEIGQQDNEPWPIDTYFRKHSGMGFACSDDTNETTKLPSLITVNGIVSNIANIGIAPYGDSWLIQNCHIFNYATRFDDAGGVHSFYSNALGAGLSTKDGVIRNCIIHDGIGSSEGIVNYTQNSIVSAVYLDNGSSNWEVDACSLYNTPWAGVFSNWNTEQTYVHDCTIANNGQAQVLFYEQPDATNSPNFLNNYKNVLEDNILVATTGQTCIFTASDGVNHNASYNPFTTGNSDRNTYVQLNTRATTTTNPVSLSAMAKHADSVFNFGSTQPGATVTHVTFATWQTRNSDDAASTVQGFYLDNTLYTEALSTIVVLANPTGTTANVDIVDNTYNDLVGATINSANVAAWSSVIAVIKPTYFYLMDGILGTNGSTITGRAPKIGNTANVISGAHTVNSSNKIASSSAGLISWNVGVADFVYEVKMRGSIAGGSLRMDVRYADATASVTHRLIVDITTATGVRIRENNDSGTLVELGTGAAFTFAANTDYTVKIIANGSNLKVYVDGVLYRDQAVNVVTGNYVAIFNDVSTNVNQTDYVVVYPI